MLSSLFVLIALLATFVNAELTFSVCGRYGGGAEVFDESAAEIVAFDSTSQLLLVSNAFTNAIDVLDISDPTAPTLIKSLNETGLGPNSVAVYDGLAAVALEADNKQEPGSVAFYDLTTDSGTYLGMVEVSVETIPLLHLLWKQYLISLLFSRIFRLVLFLICSPSPLMGVWWSLPVRENQVMTISWIQKAPSR